MEHIGHFPISMETCMDNRLTLTTEKTQQKPFQGKAYEQCCSTHSISPHSQKNTVLSHAEFPVSRESMPFFQRKQFLQGKEKFTLPDIENMPFFLGNQFLQGKEKFTLGTKLKPFMDTLDTDQKVIYIFQRHPQERKNDYSSYDWYRSKNSQHGHHTHSNECTSPG